MPTKIENQLQLKIRAMEALILSIELKKKGIPNDPIKIEKYLGKHKMPLLEIYSRIVKKAENTFLNRIKRIWGNRL